MRIFWLGRYYKNNHIDIDRGIGVLVGKTISNFEQDEHETYITTECGVVLKIYHKQDCCESVSLYDSDNDDVVGGYVTLAEEVCGESEVDIKDILGWTPDSVTWTFVKINTTKGSIWQRWLGESNGYYSESVDFEVGFVVGSKVWEEYEHLL